MSTWNTIARSKRAEWRRKEDRPDWEREMYANRAMRQWERWMSDPTTATFRAAEILEASKYRPFATQIYRSPGEILRLVLGDRADHPEGPPYTHTYTPGHPWDWEFLPGPENDE